MNRRPFVVGFSINVESTFETDPAIPSSVEKVPACEFREGFGGSPVITRTLRVLGQPACQLGIVGKDPWEHLISRNLEEWGIPHRLYRLRKQMPRVASAPNLATSRILSYRPPILDGDERNAALVDLRASVQQWAPACCVATSIRPEDGIFVTTMFESVPADCMKVFSPNPLSFGGKETDLARLCEMTDLLALNEAEAACALFGQGYAKLDFQQIPRLCEKFGVEKVLVTYNSHGSYFMDSGHFLFQPAVLTEVVDASGAGDAFIAGFLSRYLDKPTDVESAMRQAAATAAAKIRHLGGYTTPSLKEIEGMLEVTQNEMDVPETCLVRA